MIACAARRYGKKVKGWWFDGCYVTHGNFRYTPELLKLYEEAARAGNPDAIVAFNDAIDIPGTYVGQYVPFEDYTAGEKNYFNSFPMDGRWAGTAQWHVLTYLGSTWGGPGCRLNTRHLAEYIYLVNRAGGVVTVDVSIYWDGGLERSQVNTFSGVREELAKLKETEKIQCGRRNLAAMCRTRCLSLRGTTLPAQTRCVGSYLGATDGDLATDITGCEEWPWQLEVDLGKVQEIASVCARYYNGYATRGRVQVSSDGKEWKTVAERDNDNPRETKISFSPVQARFVRYAALTPNLEATFSAAVADIPADHPFFFVQHRVYPNTVEAYPWCSEWWCADCDASRKLLSRHRNAVAICGHAHSNLLNEGNFWRGEFTAVEVPSLSQLAHPRASGIDRSKADETSAQCLILNVWPDRVAFERWDARQNRQIAGNWERRVGEIVQR